MNCVACGAEIEIPADDDPRWSVRTEIRDGVEVVVERHVSILCPACGVSETRPQYDNGGRETFPACYNLVVEPVDPPRPLA